MANFVVKSIIECTSSVSGREYPGQETELPGHFFGNPVPVAGDIIQNPVRFPGHNLIFGNSQNSAGVRFRKPELPAVF